MSFVNAVPEHVAEAATDLANIGSAINSANATALTPTSGVLAAGADEVSASIAALFGLHAQAYQALSAQAALFHQQFVQLMNGAAAQYAIAEAANASPLQTAGQGVVAGVNAPSQAQTGHALTGNGAIGVHGIGAKGASGWSGTGGQAGGNGGAGRLVGDTSGAGRLIGGTAGSGGIGPAAAAVGNGGASGWFGAGGVAGTGSSPVNDNLGGVGATGGYGGLVASVGAGEAAKSAEGLGIGESGGTPVAAAPATVPAYPPATARPAAPTPAYSRAPAAAAASLQKRPAATAGT